MEIKDLPEFTKPNFNDWVIIQRGNLTGKIKLSKLSIDDGNNTPIVVNDEDDMYLGQSEPSNPTPGKMWGRLNTNNELTDIWIWQPNITSSSYAWISDIKEIRFTLTNANNYFQMELGTRNDYLFKTVKASFYSTNGDSDITLNLSAGGNSNLFTQNTINSLSGYVGSTVGYINYANINNGFISTSEPYTSDSGAYPGVYLFGAKAEVDNASIEYAVNGLVSYQLIRK